MALTPKNFTCSGGVQVADNATLEISLASTARAIVDAMPASVVAITGNTTLTKASHQGKLLYCTEASPGTPQTTTLTVDASTDFDAYASCTVYAATGVTVVVSGSGATIHTNDGKASFIDTYGFGQILAESAADTYIVTCEQNFAAALDALSDVAITSVGNGEVLVYDTGTSKWINQTLAAAGIVGVGGALGTPSSGTLTNCTGLPVSGITASTSTSLGVGSIELGHASDTTIARSAAGVATIEGVRIATLKGVNSVNATGNLVNNTINEFYGSTGSQTLTLPTMADGDSLVVDNTSSVSVTIGRNSQTINGSAADDTLTTGKAVTYYWRASGALRRIGALS